MPDSKEIVVNPLVGRDDLPQFVKDAVKEGVKLFVCRPDETELVKSAGGVAASPSEDADIFLVSSLDEAAVKKREGRQFALKVKVEGNEDIATAVSAAKMGAEAVVVETGDWKIIPLENLIADTHRVNTSIYAKVDSPDEVPTMFSILELGVDGVVLSAEKIDDVKQALKHLSSMGRVDLIFAKVTEVKNLGVGDRACIDTASILNPGEGILVGSQAKTLFLIHNESSGSKFTSPRPFRVNAGSIHSYILMPDGKTRYLSEIESGDEVLAVDKEGNTRTVVVGRVKIERRPLTLVKVEYEGGYGSVLLQNAETIPLIGRDGKQIPVTELNAGDEILVKVDRASGRHFGVSVDEFVLEK
ncbi:MAG: 3-dehydroquinate synthase II [Nitrososphaerales archaeon]